MQKKVTVGLGVTASGKKLEPQIILKGAESGRIFNNECRPNNYRPDRESFQ